MSRERPILFSAPMVRAILAGRKTQTRRAIRDEGVRATAWGDPARWSWDSATATRALLPECPYGQPGDRLWVRETLRGDGQPGDRREGIARYGADGEMVLPCATCGIVHCHCEGGPSARMDVVWEWKRLVLPSIHMPRWASRLTLEVTEVRVERLQDISRNDAIAEGMESRTYRQGECPVAEFARLWDSLNADRASWDANPWVWVVGFKVAEVRR